MIMQINTDISAYSTHLVTDIQLFSAYLFKTHQIYMGLSIILLLLALFLSIFLTTKYTSNNTQKLLTYAK